MKRELKIRIQRVCWISKMLPFLEHEPNFWKRLLRFIILVFILLIGWLYTTYLPPEGELRELELLK